MFVVGSGILHHLTHEEEARYLEEAARLFGPDGEVRFSEPPPFEESPGDPEYGLHPPRDNRAEHHLRAGGRFFREARVIPIRRRGRLQALAIRLRGPRPAAEGQAPA